MSVATFHSNYEKTKVAQQRKIEDELRNIKLSELELGHRMKKIMIPELSPIQKEVLEILKTKTEQGVGGIMATI